MDYIRQFIDNLASGNNTEAKESIENALSTKAFDALDAHKKQIGQTIFNSETEDQIEAQNTDSE